MRHRRSERFQVAMTLAVVGLALMTAEASAQLLRSGRKPATSPAAAAAAAAPAEAEPAPEAELTRRLVNPSEPIAKVNGEVISRQQLADECVARKGEEILETLIARKLIDQAIRAGKVEVSPAEVENEIERVALSIAGVSREKWLATLAKERKISPSQYARDIIYPGLALRKLAAPFVKVTDEDVKSALEAQYGDKLRCRMIMLNSLPIAKEVWEELKANPAMFEKLAQEKSIDPSTRSVGGMLPDPISRHAYPLNVSNGAFEQLVDGVKKDEKGVKTSVEDKYKPKDGDVSGIIQVTEATWVIFKRENVIAARPYDPADPALRQQVEGTIYEAKIQERIGELYTQMMQQASIENMLTGSVKEPGSVMPPSAEALQAAKVDTQVQSTSSAEAAITSSSGGPAAAGSATAAAPAAAASGQKVPAAKGVSTGDRERAQGLIKKD